MKLYILTEEQIIFIIQEAREVDWYERNFDFTVEDITSQLTPIELPSDEYIDEVFQPMTELHQYYKDGFINGAKWMKEIILNQIK